MTKLSSFLYNQSGVISIVVIIILLGLGVLALNTVLNSNMNQTSSNNYKSRIQTFHAADGLMTMLAQDMIDTNEDNYLRDIMLNQDIGAPTINGSHSYDTANDIDIINAGGSDIWNASDQFHFFYSRVKGDVDVSVKVKSVGNTDPWAKGGIMIREKLSGNSKNAMVLRPNSTALGIKLQFRRTDGALALDSTLTPSQDAYWIRLKRAGDKISAYRSLNGSLWVLVSSRTIPMTDSVYVGLAVTSHNTGVRCTALFSNLNGLVRRSCTDSTSDINNDIPVKYTIDEVGAGIFRMTTNGYKFKGTARKQNFNTCLNQTIYRKRSGILQDDVRDSAFIPVTYYDMRDDMSNPEFNLYVTVHAPCPPCNEVGAGYLFPNLVETNALTADRKLIKKNPNATFRNDFMSCWNSSWYTISPNIRGGIMNINNPQPTTLIKSAIQKNPSFSWCFNDSMHTWFRPSGDSVGKTGAYTFDYLNSRWSGLKVRPGWTPGPENDTEWVTQHWNPANPFANIVMYDSIKLIEDPLKPGVFTFGKDQSDQRWFLSCYDKNPFSPVYGVWPARFMPLQNRGFGYDAQIRYWVDPAGDKNCFLRQNFGFTMEIHHSFAYKKGQVFEFKGDDDVWAFINNRCVINLGGVHGAAYSKVNLDTLGLSEGSNYMFDFFYVERSVIESNILITTNLLLFSQPQQAKRNWKRDYGNID